MITSISKHDITKEKQKNCTWNPKIKKMKNHDRRRFKQWHNW